MASGARASGDAPATGDGTGEGTADGTVDWSAIRERLAASIQGARRRSPRDVLTERALALARPVARSDRGGSTGDTGGGGVAGAEDVSTLVVTAGDSRYAVPLADVVEIVRTDRLVPLPGADPTIVGVMPWRGRVLAVRALGERHGDTSAPGSGLDRSEREAASERRVVIVDTVATPIALLVDSVAAVQTMPSALFAPTTDEVTATRVPTLGVTSDAVAALDVAELRRRTRSLDASASGAPAAPAAPAAPVAPAASRDT